MIKEKIQKFIALFLTAAMTFSAGAVVTSPAYADMCGGLELADVYDPDPTDTIQDPILHWAVRSSLNSIKDRNLILTPELIGSKTVDTIIYENGSHPEDFGAWGNRRYLIKSLDGLQYATSASHIDISYSGDVAGNEIEDLTPLAGLTQLTKLKLYRDGITDISALAGLTNVKELSVRSNQIADITSVNNMANLTNLDFGYNNVTDASAVANLTKLKYLDMGSNQIEILPDLTELKNLESLNVSDNKLTNDALAKISKVTSLRELDLSKNTSITDVKPLVELTNLNENKTFLPVSKETKDDLFAAIKVNSELQAFNISRMTEEDLDYVKIALDDYDALTDEQKSYLDKNMVSAAKSNYDKVKRGAEPEYFEEYDKGGIQKPVLNRVDVSVVDESGHPIEDVKLVRTGLGSLEYRTDANGRASIPHSSWDAGKFTISVAAEGYICKPNSITYEVKNHKTYVINDKRATGFEKLQFVLIPEDQYVDKSELEAAIDKYGSVEDEYKYSDASYETYASALQAANNALSGSGLTQEAVDDATSNLKAAYEGLEDKKVLTTLKIRVRDENGNFFVRAFKFQVHLVGNDKDAWNIYSDEKNEISTGVAKQSAMPTWKAGAEYEVFACNHEAYVLDKNIKLTIARKYDGTVYFSKVNGKPVDSSFSIDVKAIPRAGGAVDKENEIFPDGSRLESYIEKAKSYDSNEYTPASYERLTHATSTAESVKSQSLAQEEYNKAGADITEAIDGLVPMADTLALERAIDNYYVKENYTTASWNNYQNVLAESKVVYVNTNALQAEVDEATAKLKKAQNELVFRGNKDNLQKKLDDAKAVEEAKVEYGYDDLAKAIAKADAVIADEDATNDNVSDAENAIDAAMDSLIFYPEEEAWDCMPMEFRAKVIDADGQPVPNVPYKVVSGGKVIAIENAVSSEKGMIDFYIDDCTSGVETVVTIDGDEFNCSDSHSFIVTGFKFWSAITTLDGKEFKNGVNLTYTVRTASKSIKSSSISISLDSEEYEETGEEIKPIITVKDGDKVLTEGEDYTVEYTDNVEAGVGSVTVTGINGYRGQVARRFRIVEMQEEPLESKRIYGSDRIGTSISAALELQTINKSGKFDNIIVASAQDYPDALAGSYLAKVKNAPVLLVNVSSEAKVSQFVRDNLSANGNVYLLGGPAAVSLNFERSLAPLKPVRLGGADRYETNIEILKEAGVTGEELIVCTGLSYPDSLSASALGRPILLVGKKLTKKQEQYLASLKSLKAYAIGGNAVVSNDVMNSIKKAVSTHPEYERVWGDDRFATSVEVAKKFFGGGVKSSVLAYGQNFPDGLSGGPVALALKAPLLLVTDNNSAGAKAFCKERKIEHVDVLGGNLLISDDTWNAVYK